MPLVNWHIITKEAYNLAREDSSLSDSSLYFISDTHELFKGENAFTEAFRFYTGEKPTTPAVGVIYFNTATLAGSVYNGTSWSDVILPVQVTLDQANQTLPVSGKAVADFVQDQIESVTGGSAVVKNVTYNSTDVKLTVVKGDDSTTDIVLNGIGVSLNYDSETGALTLKDKSGATLGQTINLALERFVQSAEYDHEARTITLTFNDDQSPITIDVGDLVDTYTVGDTSTVDLTMSGNNITAAVKVSATAGNIIQASEDGLYAAATDISGKMDKLTAEDASEVIIVGANGNASASGVKIGGATATANNASTLATEAAVEAIRSALQTSIDGKVAKLTANHANEVVIAAADGNVALSGKTIGGATFTTNDANTLATEAGVVAKISDVAVAKTAIVAMGAMADQVATASNEKVISEKALVDALTWKTTV